jgi:hypothetical protein
LTESERREERLVLERLRSDASVLVSAFELPLRTIEPERPNVKRRYGVCDSDGNIRVRLRHATTGRLLKYSALVDTLCHELAHLRHFNHGPRFKDFYLRILGHARRVGIYRPTPRYARATAAKRREPVARQRGPGSPAQLDLFGLPGGAGASGDRRPGGLQEPRPPASG